MTIHYKRDSRSMCARATIVQECSPTHLQVKVTDMQRQQTVVDCPRSMVGRVIGKGGETIKALQQYTGAMIQIDQSCEPTKVTVAGSAQSLQLAVSMVRDIVAGNFKGFALLRQLTSGTGPQLPQGYEQFTQAQPVYVEGYGFVPPSQVRSHKASVLRTVGLVYVPVSWLITVYCKPISLASDVICAHLRSCVARRAFEQDACTCLCQSVGRTERRIQEVLAFHATLVCTQTTIYRSNLHTGVIQSTAFDSVPAVLL